MNHEFFKLFAVSADNLNTPDVEAFLEKEINPKSISVIYNEDDTALLSIGYTKEKISHHFQLVTYTLNGYLNDNLSTLEKEIEQNAQKAGGVVCQDINILRKKIVVTFLTAKQI